jgi:hypothetical protein
VQQPFQNKPVLLGEAKIIDGRGFDWYKEGLTTLVEKYNRGRDPVGLMVGYCRKPDLVGTVIEFMALIESQSVAGFREHVSLSKYQLENCLNGQMFITQHQSSGRPIDIIHVIANLYAPVGS